MGKSNKLSNKLQLSGVVIPALASIWTEYGLKRISVGCHQDWEDSEIIFHPRDGPGPHLSLLTPLLCNTIINEIV